jgi:hypothetical protein
LTEPSNRRITSRHGWLLAALLLCVYGTIIVATGGLHHPIRADEDHFWATTRDYFVQPFPPSAASLREYPELITPLSYVLWGQLERWTGHGIFAGRVVNLLMSAAIVWLIASSRRSRSAVGLGAAIGLLAYPYFLALGVHLYTDMIAAFFLIFGLHLHLRGRPWAGCVLFVLAIATRQYVVQVPAAIAAWEAARWLRKEQGAHLVSVIAPGLACASLLGWIVFWGGLAPQPGIDRWVPRYPTPMLTPYAFILHYGLYFLVVLGAYFTAVEAVIFRELPSRSMLVQPWVGGVAVALAVLFWAAPPFLTEGHPGGIFGRVVRTMLPGEVGDAIRITMFYGLALIGAVRVGIAGGLPLLIVIVCTIMSMKSQLPWEKYLFPCLLPLWYLRSRPDLPGGMPGVRASGTH